MTDRLPPPPLPWLCPCGTDMAEEDAIVSAEILIGYAMTVISLSADIEPNPYVTNVDWEGGTEMSWDSTATAEYLCRICHAKVAPDLQAYLAQELSPIDEKARAYWNSPYPAGHPFAAILPG